MPTITNKMGLPESIVEAVRNDPYDSEGSDLTASGMVQPTRIWALKRGNGDRIVEDASDRIYALLGQAVHTILERAEPSALTEKRLFTVVDGWKISGQYDRLVLSNGNLQDYKVTTVYQANHVNIEHVWQMNVLAYLARKHGHTINSIETVLIFRDWSLQKAKRDSNHPQKPVMVKPLELWPFEKQEEFLTERVATFKKALEVLPECSDEDRWLRGEKWAVMKKGNKRAVKLYEYEHPANEHALEDPKYYTEHRKGEYLRCMDYCSVSEFCEQWRNR